MRILKIILFSLFFLFFVFSHPSLSFADITTNFDKPSYAIGENIQMTINEIPYSLSNQQTATYNVIVFPKGANKGTSYVAAVKIHTNQDAGGPTQSCTVEVLNPQSAWTSTPTCTHPGNGTNFTFIGTLNGNKIQEDPNATVDMVYSVNVNAPNSDYGTWDFRVNAVPQNTSFRISTITSDGVALYNYPNVTSNSVSPGKTVSINFYPAQQNTRYVWGKAGDPNNPSGTCSNFVYTPFATSCTVNYTIPSNASVGQFNIDVLESVTNNLAHASILVTGATPIPSGIGVNGAPTYTPVPPTDTPQPTPFPPSPPCSTTFRNTNGDFLGCGSVYTGLGVNIDTNPGAFVRDIFAVLLSLSGGIAILLIIRAGYQMMTSAGNPEAIKEARDRITSAIIGLLFLIFSLIILEVIGVDILHIPGLTH